ncbi:uncharacterized protein METZ01_LOCUS210691, partial [marine metagenome]
ISDMEPEKSTIGTLLKIHPTNVALAALLL